MTDARAAELKTRLDEFFTVGRIHGWCERIDELLDEFAGVTAAGEAAFVQEDILGRMEAGKLGKDEVLFGLAVLKRAGRDAAWLTAAGHRYLRGRLHQNDFRFIIRHIFNDQVPLPKALAYDITERLIFSIRDVYDKIVEDFRSVPYRNADGVILYLILQNCRGDLNAQNHELVCLILTHIEAPIPDEVRNEIVAYLRSVYVSERDQELLAARLITFKPTAEAEEAAPTSKRPEPEAREAPSLPPREGASRLPNESSGPILPGSTGRPGKKKPDEQPAPTAGLAKPPEAGAASPGPTRRPAGRNGDGPAAPPAGRPAVAPTGGVSTEPAAPPRQEGRFRSLWDRLTGSGRPPAEPGGSGRAPVFAERPESRRTRTVGESPMAPAPGKFTAGGTATGPEGGVRYAGERGPDEAGIELSKLSEDERRRRVASDISPDPAEESLGDRQRTRPQRRVPIIAFVAGFAVLVLLALIPTLCRADSPGPVPGAPGSTAGAPITNAAAASSSDPWSAAPTVASPGDLFVREGMLVWRVLNNEYLFKLHLRLPALAVVDPRLADVAGMDWPSFYSQVRGLNPGKRDLDLLFPGELVILGPGPR